MATTRRCAYCGHSRAAHADGVQCALCRCRSQPMTVVQESFTFRDGLPIRGPTDRKR